jgi:hypothetical protein
MKQVYGVIFGNKLLKKSYTFSFIWALSQHKTWVLNRSDILDIGNTNIVLYRIKFMQAIHSPNTMIKLIAAHIMIKFDIFGIGGCCTLGDFLNFFILIPATP